MNNNASGANLPFTADQARRVLASPEGRQLIQLLSRDGGAALQQAAQALRAGDYAALQQTLAPLMQTPQAQQLLAKLTGGK